MSSIDKSVTETVSEEETTVSVQTQTVTQSTSDENTVSVDRESIEVKIKELVFEQLCTNSKTIDEPGKVMLAHSFVQDLSADSLDTVELVMSLEENFNLEIKDEEAEEIKTVQDAVDYVGARIAPESSSADVESAAASQELS